MNRFEWNGLRCGDIVFVHHPPLALAVACRGTVDSVAVVAHHGNQIGVRLDTPNDTTNDTTGDTTGDTTNDTTNDTTGDQKVVWPSWLTVHRAVDERSGSCWRCDELANLAAPEPTTTVGTP